MEWIPNICRTYFLDQQLPIISGTIIRWSSQLNALPLIELNHWPIMGRIYRIGYLLMYKVPSPWIISKHWWENGWAQLVVVQYVTWSFRLILNLQYKPLHVCMRACRCALVRNACPSAWMHMFACVYACRLCEHEYVFVVCITSSFHFLYIVIVV